jgi:hypothetical protein
MMSRAGEFLMRINEHEKACFITFIKFKFLEVCGGGIEDFVRETLVEVLLPLLPYGAEQAGTEGEQSEYARNGQGHFRVQEGGAR